MRAADSIRWMACHEGKRFGLPNQAGFAMLLIRLPR